MDRQIVYPGAIPLETDLLNSNKYAMIAIAKQSLVIAGTSTVIHGLACAPTSPASMAVSVDSGIILSLQNVDGTAYSSIDADTTHSIIKQGIKMDANTINLDAPSTTGQSVNYLIQVAYQDIDSGSTVLPYYNATNPSVAWSGPANSGAAQNTVRAGMCIVSVKTGVAATTGLQSTPVPDAGYVGAWVVTVANGQVSIVSSNISRASNAPFLPSKGIVPGIQSGAMTHATDTGSANTYVVSCSPPITSLVDGHRISFKATNANTTSSTLTLNGLTNYPIYSQSQQTLQGGEIVANGIVQVAWNSTLNAFVICNSSGGRLQVPSATNANHAVNLSQLNSSSFGRFLGVRTITASGNYTPTAGTTFIRVKAIGGGGAGGSCPATSSSQTGGSPPGFYGQFIDVTIPVSAFTSPVSITIGAGGTPGGAGAFAGGSGSPTIFGLSLIHI